MTKKILSLFIALMMILCALPAAASAQSGDMSDTAAGGTLTEAKLAGGRAPVVGEVANRSFGVHTFDEKYYSATFRWYDMSDDKLMKDTDIIVNTKTYALLVLFTPVDGYDFPNDVSKVDVGFYNDIRPTVTYAYVSKESGTLTAVFMFRMSGCASRIVYFDPNGGKGGKMPELVAYGGSYTLPECDFNRSDGAFSCWNAGSVGDKITVTKDTKLKALWTRNNPISNTITELLFSGGKQPAAGEKPDYSFCVHKKHTDRYTLNSVQWWNLSDDKQMMSGDTFDSSKVYALRLAVTAKSGYAFISNYEFIPSSDSTVKKIDFGEDIRYSEHIVYDIDSYKNRAVYFIFKMDSSDCVMAYTSGGGTGEMRPRAYTYAAYIKYAECGFTPEMDYQEFYSWSKNNAQPGDTLRLTSDITVYAVWGNASLTVVSELNVRVTDPRVGEAPDYEASVALDDRGKYTARFYGKWYDASLTRDMTPGETFKENHAYSFQLYFSCEKGYRFARPEDMTVRLINSSCQNLSTYIETSGDELQKARYVTFYYGVPSKYLDRMDASFTVPRAGRNPSFTASTNTLGVSVDNVKWYSGGTVSIPGAVMKASDTFASGGTYIAEITFHADMHYAIDPDAKAKFNKSVYQSAPSGIDRFDPITRVFRYSYTLPAAGSEITTLSAQISTLKGGDTLPDNALAGSSSYRITDIGWYTEGTASEPKAQLMPGAIAVDGKTYFAMVYFTPTNTAAIADKPTATVNGVSGVMYGGIMNDGSARFVVPITIGASAGSYWIGDVNADGAVKNRDALILDRYIAGWKDAADQIKNWDAADINRDGKVKNRDALMLDRYIAGWNDHQKYVFQVNG